MNFQIMIVRIPSKVKGISLNNLYAKVFESIKARVEKSITRLFGGKT